MPLPSISAKSHPDMIITISLIPDAAQLRKLTEKLENVRWQDGRETAGAQASAVKRNEQAKPEDKNAQAVKAEIEALIRANAVFQAAARPKQISRLMISRTQDGGHYGSHIDNAIMGQDQNHLRSDLAFTVFLSDPATYDGGELVVHHAGHSQEIKADAGHMVLYPANSIHEVQPVTRGQRVVCVGWVQSLIRSPEQRELLFDLENLRASMRSSSNTVSQELITLDKSIANLLRMWAEP